MRPLSSVLALVMVAACAPPPSGDATIAVRLADDAVVLQPEAVTTGRIVFDTTNTSAGLVHEIEVFADAVAGEVLPVVDSVADTTGHGSLPTRGRRHHRLRVFHGRWGLWITSACG